MRYELRIPASLGDVVPLVCVADAMARAASTAYGKAPPHKPAYNGRLPMYVKLLLNESRAGRLRVCNQFEHQGTAEELISAAESSGDLSKISRYLMEPDWEKVHRENPPILAGVGVWDLTGIDLGPTEVDWDSTHLVCLCAKLHHLNEWGRANGDEFVINSDAVKWIDERGVMAATAVINKTEDHPTIRTDANTLPAQSPATPEPEPASPEFEKLRLFWRAVRFDENRVEAAMGELERFDTKDVSEIAFRDKKLAALTENLAQIEGRKDVIAVQMGAGERRLAEHSFAVAKLAESRRPLDTSGKIERTREIDRANKEIDALIAKRTAPRMGLADASGGVELDKAGPDDKKPWLVADPTDPTAPHHWYTPARYFARQLVRSDSTLLIKTIVLADKVSKSLANAGIYKRGGKKPHAAATVLKAFSNVTLG